MTQAIIEDIDPEDEDRPTPLLDALMRYDEFFSNETREVK